jgi:hypothetical protein
LSVTACSPTRRSTHRRPHSRVTPPRCQPSAQASQPHLCSAASPSVSDSLAPPRLCCLDFVCSPTPKSAIDTDCPERKPYTQSARHRLPSLFLLPWPSESVFSLPRLAPSPPGLPANIRCTRVIAALLSFLVCGRICPGPPLLSSHPSPVPALLSPIQTL